MGTTRDGKERSEIKSFTQIVQPTFELIKLVETKSDRYYTLGGKRYTSVTTITGALTKHKLDGWHSHMKKTYGIELGMDIANRTGADSMKVGTAFHKIMECYLSNKEIPTYEKLAKSPRVLFEQCQGYVDKMFDNVQALEVPLHDKDLLIAGTADFVGESDGELTLADWKTSKKKKDEDDEAVQAYFIQAALYAMMWKKLTGTPIEKLVIFMTCWDKNVMCFTKRLTPELEAKALKIVEDFKNAKT